MRIFRKINIFLIIIGFFVFPKVAFAVVVINEVYPNPNTGEDEWVELWNNDESSVDLKDWKLWDQLSSPGVAHQFAQETVLAANSFLVLPLQNVLNNSGDELVLKNGDGQEIDRLAYTNSTKGKSWGRDPTTPAVIAMSDPTPNEPNLSYAPSPTPTPSSTYSGQLPMLSEIMACPTDSDEWVEIANPHSAVVPLAGFTLRDSKSQIFSFTNQEIEPNGFLAVDLRNVLNNGGDSVSLISPINQVVDTHTYSACVSDKSWAKKDSQWQVTEFVTKNSANIFSASNKGAAIIEIPSTTTKIGASSIPINPGSFVYPASVLKPRLSYQKPGFPAENNIAFGPPPRLERGALGVIMGSLFLLIPGVLYVKNRSTHF